MTESSSTSFTDHLGRPRVAVVGLGVKTPAGCDLETFWSTLLAGRSMAGRIQLWDASALTVQIACEVLDFDPVDYFAPKEVKRADRVAHLGFAAAADALADAGELGADPARCGVVVGTGIGGIHTLHDQTEIYLAKGPSRVSPYFVPMMMANATAGHIGMRFGWKGPNTCISTACAAGTHAVGEAVRLVRDGTSDIVMAGGTEAVVSPVPMAAFARMGALSGRNDEPHLASRPYDVARNGFVMGEGAAFLVLERLDRAIGRGARIYGEIIGYGRNADAYHITAPSPGGEGATACMQLALADAGLEPSQIGHINGHGTSTPLNDAAEGAAVHKVFGDSPPPITSTKGVTGHLIGAAGATEAVASFLAIRDGIVPPTANVSEVDPEINLDVVRGEPRKLAPAPVISNSFGFGGHNATVILAPTS